MARGHENFERWDGKLIHNPPEKFDYKEGNIIMTGEGFDPPAVRARPPLDRADEIMRIGDWTLGEEQYFWFREILENSDALFKFIFCHQLVGGKDTEGRGGGEYAGYYEMGGMNEDGTWGFDAYRPGWDKPIHQLMVENDVSVFFHGHDHFYAEQAIDGMKYQLGPQPAHINDKDKIPGQAIEYGYVDGAILPHSGHLRVMVTSDSCVVQFVRAVLLEDESEDKQNGEILRSYTVYGNGMQSTGNSNAYTPRNIFLYQNYPNPFNPITTITYDLSKGINVSLIVFDILGREVERLMDTYMEPGYHQVQWDGQGYPSGIYIARLVTPEYSKSIKMVLLK
ncbi:T9SS type A sorting domain-containing protein [Candidatus Neomarinimicrobiota bacterium]